MFGRNPNQRPPEWQANFTEYWEEVQRRTRFSCNKCKGDFSYTGAKNHCCREATEPQAGDQNLPASERPKKKGRHESRAELECPATRIDSHSDSHCQDQDADIAAAPVYPDSLDHPSDGYANFDEDIQAHECGGSFPADMGMSDTDGATGDAWREHVGIDLQQDIDQLQMHCGTQPIHSQATTSESGPNPNLHDALLTGNFGTQGGLQVQDVETLLAEEEREYLAQLTDLSQFENDELPDCLQTWETVANCQVCEDLPGLTVRQAAFSILHTIHTQHTTFESAQQLIYLTCCGLLKSKGSPSPTNPKNRFPTSLAVCYKVTGVCDISDFEVHLCPSDADCTHAFRSKMEHPEAHLQHCPGCQDCKCPKCGTARFEKENGSLRPGFMMYFFGDVLQQLFLDREWWKLLQDEQRTQGSAWRRTKECKDLVSWFSGIEVDPKMVRSENMLPSSL